MQGYQNCGPFLQRPEEAHNVDNYFEDSTRHERPRHSADALLKGAGAARTCVEVALGGSELWVDWFLCLVAVKVMFCKLL